MKKLSCYAFVLFIGIALGGCKHDTADTLEGAYGATKNGKVEPVMKVERTKAGYVFDDSQNGNWRTGADIVEPANKEEFEKLIGAPVMVLSWG